MIYRETQKFTQWWLWIFLVGLTVLPIYSIIQQLVFKKEFGNNPMSDWGLIIFAFGIFIFVYFFYSITLITEIDKHEIRIRFNPFLKKNIRWSEVASAKIINYGFVGYGIRYGSRHGVVYNIKGKIGLALILKNGQKMVIGTQRHIELDSWLLRNRIEQTNPK